MNRLRILSSHEFSADSSGTEYAEVDFGFPSVKGGILRLPLGTRTAPHNHHETEMFFLAQGRVHVGNDSSHVLSKPGDIAVIEPFESHTLINAGEDIAVLFDVYFEDIAAYREGAADTYKRQASDRRSLNVVDLRATARPGTSDLLLACHEHQGWPVRRLPNPIAQRHMVDADFAQKARRIFRSPNDALAVEPYRSLCIDSVGRFSLGREVLVRAEALLSASIEPVDLSLDGPCCEAAAIAAVQSEYSLDQKGEQLVVIVGQDQLARIFPAVPLLLTHVYAERDFSSVVFLTDSDASRVLDRSSERFLRVYADFCVVLRSYFEGRIPVAGSWNSNQVAAFAEIEAICQRASSIVSPERFTAQELGRSLDALVDLAVCLLAESPWSLREGTSFDSMLRTNLALVASALRAFTVLFEPCLVASRNVLSGVHPAIRPVGMPWEHARQLIPETMLEFT
jgi:quercetin dioxygenase-like cupin family protein